MATKLEKALRREVTIRGKPFVVNIDPDGLKLVAKGRRKGLELAWEDLVSGEAALATALAASLNSSLPLEPAKQTKHTGARADRLRLVKGANAHGGRPPAGRKARRRAS